MWVIAVSLVFVVIIVGMVQSILWKRNRLYQVISKEEVRTFFSGKKIFDKPGTISDDRAQGISIPLGIGYNKKRFEICKKSFEVGEYLYTDL